jgi:branched-chain amino acid transport system substrate-binding protein
MINRRRLMAAAAAGFTFGVTNPLSRAVAQPAVIKIGLLLPYTGQFSYPAAQMDDGIKLYLKQHGETVAGGKIELIRRDTNGAPDVAKRLAQELIVNDRVDILAGFVITPEALAVASLSADAKKFMVVMNAGASIITTKSPYITRSAFTLPQNCEPLGRWAYANGVRRVYTMVSDYAPGHDAEAAFQHTFKEAGGEIIGSSSMPLEGPDFSAYVQRAKDAMPEGIFVSVPGGSQPIALAKALIERGVDPAKFRIMGSGELTDEAPLNAMGDSAIGIVTAFHYDHTHKSAENAAFVKAYNAEFNRNPDNVSVGGYDGMHVIYEALKKSNGSTDADKLIAAAKNLKWESPRGTIAIDPDTRDIINTVYIRRVEKVSGHLENVEIEKYEAVKDPGKAHTN